MDAQLPEGFSLLERDGWRIAARDGEFDDAMADPRPLAATGEARYAGRGRPVRVALPGGGHGVLRRYLHGGLLRHLTGSRFLGHPRPLTELAATEAARRGGVRVPDVIAAWFRPRFPSGHEGWILTREIENARDLVEVLGAGEPAGPVLRLLGEETRRMHAAGVWHADLHVKNVLLADGAVVIIDFDRGRVLDPIPEFERVGNLLRFDRSVVKLGRSGVWVPLRDRLRFFHGYRDGPVDRRTREDVVRRCRKSLARHRRWWSLSGTGRK